jgi:hypothetical protein
MANNELNESIAIVKSAIYEFYGYAIVCFVAIVAVLVAVICLMPSPTNIIVALCIAIGAYKFAEYNIKLAKANSRNLNRAIAQKSGFEIITSLKAA